MGPKTPVHPELSLRGSAPGVDESPITVGTSTTDLFVDDDDGMAISTVV